MNWTCCVCENQVDERHYDLAERMCDDCMDEEYLSEEKEGNNMGLLLDLTEYLIYWLSKIGMPLAWFMLGVLVGQLVLIN